MNAAVADALAPRLGELVHPGDDKTPATVVMLPGFRTAGMPPELADEVAKQGKLVAEAIVATIEDGGYAIVPVAEIVEIRKRLEVTAPPVNQIVRVTCSACHAPLFSVNITTGNPSVNGPYFLEQMHKLPEACPHTPA